MDPTRRALTIHKRLNAYGKYKIPPFPPRLAAPEPSLDWLASQKPPRYSCSGEEPIKAATFSIFQPDQDSSMSFELADSLPLTGADAIAPQGYDGRYTCRHQPLTRALGLSLARFGGRKRPDKATSQLPRETSSHSYFWALDAAEIHRRRLRLRYRKHRKQRQGMFPWQRRKKPRVLGVEDFAVRGKLEWLMAEICRMEAENGRDDAARGWLWDCKRMGFLRRCELELEGVDADNVESQDLYEEGDDDQEDTDEEEEDEVQDAGGEEENDKSDDGENGDTDDVWKDEDSDEERMMVIGM